MRHIVTFGRNKNWFYSIMLGFITPILIAFFSIMGILLMTLFVILLGIATIGSILVFPIAGVLGLVTTREEHGK